MVYVSAISPNGTTEQMEYKLFKDGSITNVTGSYDYKLTNDTSADSRKSYYSKDSEGNYILVEEPIFNGEIYERIYKFNFDEFDIIAGEYKIQVINVVGYDSDGQDGNDKVYTKSIFTHTLVLPDPKKPTIAITNNAQLIFSNEINNFTLSAQVDNWDGIESGAVLNYIWYKDNEIIEGENTATLTVISSETEANSTEDEYKHIYKVKAINSLHGKTAESDLSNLCSISYAPSAFADVAISSAGSPKAGAAVTATYSLVNTFRSDKIEAKWFIDGQEYSNSNENSLVFIIPTTGDYRGLSLTCKLYNEYNGARIEASQIPSITIAAN